MRCDVCRHQLTRRRATPAAPYQYTLSGLEGVWLVGIETHLCPRCFVEVPVLPRMRDLNRLLAAVLVERPGNRTGPEMRLLRKAARMNVETGAKLLAMDPSELAQIEMDDSQPGQRIVLQFAGGRWREIGAETQKGRE